MSINLTSKVEEIKRISINSNKVSSKKDKKSRSIQEWSIKLPPKIQNSQNTPYNNGISFSYQVKIDPNSSQENKMHQKHDDCKTQSQQTLHSMMGLFIQEILQLKYNTQSLDKIINCAQNTPLSTLWNIQYTNNLSLFTQLINQALSNNKTQSKYFTPGNINEDNQNKDQSNIESQEHQHEKDNKKKKRKIKKSNNNKKQQNIPHQKDTSQHNNKSQTPQQLNVSHEINKLLDTKQNIQKILTLNLMLQKIQREILRVENLFIQEMQNIHILPYVQAEEKLVQSESRHIKKNISKLNPQKIYPLEGMEKQYLNSQSYGMGSQLSSSLNNRQNITNNNYPFINYEYQMGGHNPSQIGQSQYQYHVSQQHMKPYNLPMVQMDTSFVQHLGHLNAQYGQNAHAQTILYGSENFMMMNPNNMNMSRGVSTKRVEASNNTNNNNRSNKMIDIDIDEQDDGVQEIRKY